MPGAFQRLEPSLERIGWAVAAALAGTALLSFSNLSPPMCLAIPGRIVELTDSEKRLARVNVAGVTRTVNVALLDSDDDVGVVPGDWVLIHVGFAISRVDEAEAAATLELLKSMGPEYEEELRELRGSRIQ